ncbi:hypothetical protein K431DRAFT_285510 [Polychaeton citri CBS 116435]|uniref:Signal recognition particle subunit SRP72 n=1 Tax=Polychaeton citri CBS 116435 TaxID=1314669 RepID=A0A9P4QA08_9PEZI|nr:hypothetical protein K431DRAFT_285510 [Polychaeton citri CBS 116435]
MSVPSLTSLLKQTDINDHEEVLKSANAVLKSSKSDISAQQAKVVALLKLDRYEDAVRTFETSGGQLKKQAQLEYAYALYKTGKAQEAADTIGATSIQDRGSAHLEAQARYRTEDFIRAAELYRQLSERLDGDAEADLKINLGAVDAQLEWAGHGQHATKGRPDLYAFETAYNSACQSIARGELAQAEVLLKRARDMCASSEDMSEEDKAAELAPITIQQIYVLTKLGRSQDAEQLAEIFDAGSIPDLSTRHIAEVNCIAAAKEPKNVFLAQRLVARDPEILKPDHPFQFQSNVLKQNHYAADLKALKLKGTADSAATAISKATLPATDSRTNSLSVVNAAAHANNQSGKEGIKYILPLLEKRPNDVGLVLTVCQLYALTSRTHLAIALLDTFFQRLERSESPADQNTRFAPGLVGTMVSLQQRLNRTAVARREFTKAAAYWRRQGSDSPAGVLNLLKAAGSALLDSPDAADVETAKEIFTELHESDKEDKFTAAGLLAASQSDASPDQYTNLTPIDRIITGIDADALENEGIALPLAFRKASVVARKRPAGEPVKPKKPNKMRKSKMPKEFDTNKKLDPERWLPMRDRSYYKPKGRKGKARQAMLAQGSAPADSEGSRPGTPGGQVVQGKGAGGQGKKKKGKGKA